MYEIKLEGKVALVCGASKGMGFASAELLMDAGANVVICARNEKNLDRALSKLKEKNSERAHALMADVSKEKDIDRIISESEKRFGQIDILVNNAGGPKPGKIESLQDADWESAIKQNLLSVIRLSNKVVLGMKQRSWGRIINITSIAAKQPIPGMVLSNVARSGVLAFSKTLSAEVASHGITVNSLCPGAIATDRFNSLLQQDAEEMHITLSEMEERVVADIPVGYIGQPSDFASLVLFLASKEAKYVTGTAIQVDGGVYKGLY